MNIYKILLTLIVVSYGGLTILAGGVQLKQRKISFASSLLMIIGGLLLIFSLLIDLPTSVILNALIGGLLIIHGCAISNGLQMFGKVNPRHHIIRLAVSIFILTLFLLK